MFAGKFHGWLVGALLSCAGASVFAGNFVAPAEGPVAFRRDRVPLDAETMATLSQQLTTLAQGLDMGKDVNRRTAAQMLALATALDPGNHRARELISTFENGRHPQSSDPVDAEKSRTRIWELLAWLEKREAGDQGQALAACLTDIMVIVDPKNPQAEALQANGERGAWTDWVPQLASYQNKGQVKPEFPQDSPPKETTDTLSGILLDKAQVFTMLWKKTGMGETLKWVQAASPIQMTADKIPGGDGASKPFSLVIGSQNDGGSISGLSSSIQRLFKNEHLGFPLGQRVTIGGDALAASLQSSKRHSISAAVAVLVNAAISGSEPEATILGTVDESGAFKLPGEFWSQLQSLGPGKGGRLILPTAAAEYLPSMLALENPQFFLDYEVLLAANFKELVDLSAKTPAEPLAKVEAQFREIREKLGIQSLGPYLANSFIRRRFTEIVLAAPNHFSAKMLAIQGAGNRPVFLSRIVLASELHRALEPMEWVVEAGSQNFDGADIDRLDSTYETCRKQVEHLVRYAEKNDHEMLGHVQDLVADLRSLDRAARGRGEDVFTARSVVMRAAARVSEELAGIEKENGSTR